MKPPKHWLSLNKLSDTEFEEFTYDLLEELGFAILDWRKRTARRRGAWHREELQLHNFVSQLGHALEPIHLSFLVQFITLRHEHFPPAQPQFSLPHLHITPHRSFPKG